ncbi:hypothetical protein [Corynebacterium halotolerans]|uniref:hypothetical protein n=1 Tax=Corynebacterium halotolerans TaxID=225326 RepID=UPI003CF841DB
MIKRPFGWGVAVSGGGANVAEMYNSLEIIHLDDYVTVFTHPEGFRHLAEAGLRTTAPLLVPSAMEVFQDAAELRHYQWDTIGATSSMTYPLESGPEIRGVTRLGAETTNRVLGAYTLHRFREIPGSTDLVLADVHAEVPVPERLELLFPARLTGEFAPGAVVWGVFDRVADITELPMEQVLSSRHPNLIFRLVLALSRGDKTLWQLMLELGESSSAVIGAAELAANEGFRVRDEGVAPVRYRLYEPRSRATHADPASATGMGGQDVRGIPMDEDAYRALLCILDRVLTAPGLADDDDLMEQVTQMLRLVTTSAPRRVLAEHGHFAAGPPSPEGTVDWDGLEDWIADREPFVDEQLLLLGHGKRIDASVLAALRRACADYALLRVETNDGVGRVVEARKLGFNWSVERILQGFDRATGQRVRIRVAELRQVEYLGQPWYR